MEDQTLRRMFCTFIFRRFEASVRMAELYKALKRHMYFLPPYLGAQAYRELKY